VSDDGNFRRLLVAFAASNLADGALQTVMPLVALGITRDPGAFATVTLVGRLPWLLFALPAGALADRLDRRRTMVIVDAGRVVVLGVLTLVVAAGRQELWMLCAVAFALGCGETLFDTAAQSILPSLVAEPDRLERANSRLYAVELTANQFIGPAAGGIVAGVALAAGVGTSTVAYVVGAVVLMTITGTFRARPVGPVPARTSMYRDIVEGLRYLAGHRLLRAMAVVVGISNLATNTTFAVFPLYAVEPGPMGLSAAGFGLLLAAVAAGSVIGTFLAPWTIRRLGPRWTLLTAMGIGPLFSLAPAVSSSVAWVAAAFVVSAAVGISWNIVTVSLRQRIVPDHLLGRVNAGYRLVAWGTMPLGAGLGGIVASQLSLTAAFWTGAGLSVLCVPIVWSQVTTARLVAAEPEVEPVSPGRA